MKQLLTLLLLAATATGYAQKYELRFQPAQGETADWNITMDMDMDMTMTGMDMEMHMDMDMGIGMHLEIVQGPDKEGLVRMSSRVDSMRLYMGGMPGMDIRFNSAEEPGDDLMARTMRESLAPLIGATVTNTIDAQGNVVSMEGYEEIMEALQEGSGGGGMSGMSSNPYDNFQSYLVGFPKGKIKVGDTWDVEQTVNSNGMPMSLNTTYTLLGVEDAVARIGVSSIVRVEEAESEQGGMTMTMSMTGTQEGTMRVRLADGMTLGSELNQDFSMDISTAGMAMPATLKGRMVLSPISR